MKVDLTVVYWADKKAEMMAALWADSMVAVKADQLVENKVELWAALMVAWWVS